MPYRWVITFLPRSKRLLISRLQSPSAEILEPPKIKSDTVSTVSHLFPMCPQFGQWGTLQAESFWCDLLIPELYLTFWKKMGFPSNSDGEESACSAVDLGSIPGPGRSLGEGNSSPLQYSCLENSVDRGAWQAIVHRIAESDTTERLTLSLSRHPYMYIYIYTIIHMHSGIHKHIHITIY